MFENVHKRLENVSTVENTEKVENCKKNLK
jgi:hypothetical protein